MPSRAASAGAAAHALPRGSAARRRGRSLATVVIAAGVVMLMQPLSLALYTWSFVTILAGTVMFVIVSHFPE